MLASWRKKSRPRAWQPKAPRSGKPNWPSSRRRQIAQRENKRRGPRQVKNYADAVAYLDQITAKGQQSKATQIEIEEAQRRVNQLGQVQDQQLQLINAGLAVDADHRALILKNLQDEIAAGVRIGDQYDDQRKQIEAKNAAIQAGQDADRMLRLYRRA
jgi:hypothetical protein